MVKSVVLPIAREILAQVARKQGVLAGQWSVSAEDGREAGPRALIECFRIPRPRAGRARFRADRESPAL